MTPTPARLLLLLGALTLPACDGGIQSGTEKDTGVEGDEDGDGVVGADDCDDTDPTVYTGAPEICDGKDNDCDAAVDGNDPDLTDGTAYYTDLDGDGFGDVDSEVIACEAPSGAVAQGGDCDDDDSSVNPDGTEDCSTGADDDCDGDINDADATGCIVFYVDADGDGHAAADADSACLCFDDDTYSVTDTDDCDDTNAEISPSAEEVCSDDIDQDCDSDWDECRLSEPFPVDARAVVVAGITADVGAGSIISTLSDIDGSGGHELVVSTPTDGDGIAYIFSTAPASDATMLSADTRIVALGAATLGTVRGVADVSEDGVDDIAGFATAQFTGELELAVWHGAAGLGSELDADDAELLLIDTGGTQPATDLFALAHNTAAADLFTVDASSGVLRRYLATGTGAHQMSDRLYGTITATGMSQAGSVTDLDGDGFDELGVAYPSNGQGVLLVARSAEIDTLADMGDAGALIVGEDDGDQFASDFASGHDLDLDGYNDLLVGASRYDTADASNAGAVYVFFGSASFGGPLGASSADVVLTGELRNDYAGDSVASLGDLDQDGHVDIGVGSSGFDASEADNVGATYAVYGPWTAGTRSLNDERGRLAGSNDDSNLGATMLGADLNGDGYSDFVMGEPGYDTTADVGAGGAWILFGAGL